MGVFHLPGKSPIVPGGVAHPAVYHMLDVAAVCEALLAREPIAHSAAQAFVFLVGLHDLGKLGDEFQRMLAGGAGQNNRHWEVTELMLRDHDDLVASALSGDRDVRFGLYAAIAGHHGRPPRAEGKTFNTMRTNMGDTGRAASEQVIQTFRELWPSASLAEIDDHEAAALSWRLAGLTAMADWIGSNPAWFPPCEYGLSPRDYLERARRLAAEAVPAAGVAGNAASPHTLFDFALRPMQAAAQEIPLRNGPMLSIIEDETGSGKTEAALILAHRMLQAGKGHGLYFALPTTATADAMFRRGARAGTGFLRRLFRDPPHVTLAHGRAAMSDDFRDVIDRDTTSSDDSVCATWFTESHRRALLADAGIGTIDQALLAILPTKFNTLRQWALSSKVLVVDEVHEMGEPYIAEELSQLLYAHARHGGSAILLTATLPLALRQKLSNAFENGAGRAASMVSSTAYPAITVAGGAARYDFPQTVSARGVVRVERLSREADAVSLLQAQAAAGAACVWIRNAVDDAVAGVEALRTAGVEAQLLHARFTLSDRKVHEARMLAHFGKEGTERAGKVLVGTQVLESSLDYDADVMVSDLAPMASLIQRGGRLWRHMDLRPAAQRPVTAPVLHVLSPDPSIVTNARWLHEVLNAGAYVYSVDEQWRTADVLFHEGQIVAPARLRHLIEFVHGANLAAVPEPIAQAEQERIGAGMSKANQARRNVIKFEDGYRDGGTAAEDTDYPTRLGEQQQVLMLARWDGALLVPWAGEGREGALLSEVQAAQKRLSRLLLPDQAMPTIAALTRDWPDWKRKQVIVCPVGTDGVICEGLLYDERLGLVFSSSLTRG